jgi:hypothetical protein
MDGGFWRIAELHSVIFIAIKLPVATGSSWPSVASQVRINFD